MTEALWLLALIAAVGAACYWAGWRASKVYMLAAQSVADITNSTIERSNAYALERENVTAAIRELTAAVAGLRNDTGALTKVTDDRYGKVETALLTIWDGLERTGLARGTRSAPGRQVGERPPDAEG